MKRIGLYVASFGMMAIGMFLGGFAAFIGYEAGLAVMVGSLLYIAFAASWGIAIAIRYKEPAP